MDTPAMTSIIKLGTAIKIKGLDDVRPIIDSATVYADGSATYNTVVHHSNGAMISSTYNSSLIEGEYERSTIISNLIPKEVKVESHDPIIESSSPTARRIPLAYMRPSTFTSEMTEYDFMVGEPVMELRVLTRISDSTPTVYAYMADTYLSRRVRLVPYVVRHLMKLLGRGSVFKHNATYIETEEEFLMRASESYHSIAVKNGELQHVDVDLSVETVIGVL